MSKRPRSSSSGSATRTSTDSAARTSRASSTTLAEYCVPVRKDGRLNGVETIDVSDSCETLWKHMVVDKEKLVFVQGSPGSGKTSLANCFHTFVESKKHFPITITHGISLKTPEALIEEANIARKSAELDTDNTVFLADEAHLAFAKRLGTNPNVSFVDVFLKSGNYNVACFSTSFANESGTTPEVLSNHKFWFFGPTFDRSKVEAYVKRVLQTTTMPEKQVDVIAESIYDYCGASMEVVLCCLRWACQHDGRLPSTMDVLNSMNPPRVVLHGSDSWTEAHKAFASRLLAQGFLTKKDVRDPAMKDLCRKGFVAPVHTAGASPLMTIGKDAEELTWAHNWQVTASHRFQVTALPTRKAPNVTPIDSPLALLTWILPFMDTNELMATRIASTTTDTGNNLPASEYNFQGALKTAISRALPHFSCVPKYPVPNGRIDFVVWPAITYEKWALELLLNGSKIKEHLGRFAKPGGAYLAAECTNYLVIDCRTAPIDVGSHPLGVVAAAQQWHFVTIAPHPARGWDIITVHSSEGTFEVPRDSVPRFRRNAEVLPAVLVDESRLTPASLWVKSVTGGCAFPVTPEVNDIARLKKAIKAELGTDYPRNAAHITILDHKGNEVTNLEQGLNGNGSENPYLYQLPT